MITQQIDLKEEAKTLVSLIIRELIIDFGKSEIDAVRYVKKANVFKSLINNPLCLHDSPHMWTLSVLAKNNDIETLEKYYRIH